MIRKDWNFCHQILRAVAILDKKLKIFIFIFSTLIFLFFKRFSTLIFHAAVAFHVALWWFEKLVQLIKNRTLAIYTTTTTTTITTTTMA